MQCRIFGVIRAFSKGTLVQRDPLGGPWWGEHIRWGHADLDVKASAVKEIAVQCRVEEDQPKPLDVDHPDQIVGTL